MDNSEVVGVFLDSVIIELDLMVGCWDSVDV